MATPTLRGVRFRRIRRENFVEHRDLAHTRTQQATEALHVFAYAAATADDDADGDLGHIDAFVQYLAGDQQRPRAGAEPFEHALTFRSLGVVRHHRSDEAAADLVGGVIVLGEH